VRPIVPSPDTVLLGDDQIIGVTPSESETALKAALDVKANGGAKADGTRGS
jgi:hypothetical protein